MAEVPVDIEPGIVKDLPSFANHRRWVDGNRIRFRNGYPEKIGGWQKWGTDTFAGVAHVIHAWSALDGTQYIAFGTEAKVYITQHLATPTYNDITPVHSTAALGADPITSSSGSGIVTINDVTHGRAVNDYVIISGATAFNGLTTGQLNQNLKILTVVDADNYTVQTGGTANASGAGGGAGVNVEYKITSGVRSTSASRVWSLDNFGEDLIAAIRDGAVYYWDKTGGVSTDMVLLSSLGGASNVPTVVRQILISDIDRHVVALGANELGSGTQDKLLVRWSSQENAVDWTPTSLNTAGAKRLSSGSEIVVGKRIGRTIIIWTDMSLHAMQFTGPPYTFSIEEVAGQCPRPIGPHAVTVVGSAAYWMGERGFYMYDGAVRQIPCPISKYIFDSASSTFRFNFMAAHNNTFNEVWFFYSINNPDDLNRYAVFNIGTGVWYFGVLTRTAWIDVPDSFDQLPIAAGTNGYMYKHENGYTDDSAILGAYVTTGEFSFYEGVSSVRRFMPDLAITPGSYPVSVTITRRNYSHGQSVSTTTAYSVTSSSKNIPVRSRARYFSIRFEDHSTNVGYWQIGRILADVMPDGQK